METKDLLEFRLKLLTHAISLKQNPTTQFKYKSQSIITMAEEMEAYCYGVNLTLKEKQKSNGKSKQILDKSLELKPISQSENTPKTDIDKKLNLITTADSLTEIKYFLSNGTINDLDENYNAKIIDKEKMSKFKTFSPEIDDEYKETPELRKSLEEFYDKSDEKFGEIIKQKEQYLKQYVSDAK